MKKDKIDIATDQDIRSQISILRTVLKSGPKAPNIWTFYSNKNRRLQTVVGDVTFIQAILLEGDPYARSYIVMNSRPGHEPDEYGRELAVDYIDGTRKLILCGRYASLRENRSNTIKNVITYAESNADKIDAIFELSTERDLIPFMTRFSNLLTLCAALTRCRYISLEAENSKIIDELSYGSPKSIRYLIDKFGYDEALVVGVIARLIIQGVVDCDIDKKAITIEHTINLSKKPLVFNGSHQVVTKTLITDQSEEIVKNNKRTRRIPNHFRNLKLWPTPQIVCPEKDPKFDMRKLAVDMYMEGESYVNIEKQTGIKKEWIRKLFKKCISIDVNGNISGYKALSKAGPRKPYKRSMPVPKSNLHERRTSGYAGSLVLLFERFPDDLLSIIEDEVLKQRDALFKEARITWKDLQKAILDYLRKQGVTNDEYPFSTEDQAYTSISNIARSILFKRPVSFIRSRYGENAERLSAQGKGIPSLIRASAPYQIVELDFHKHDSAAIVQLTGPIGNIINAAVPRSWIGGVVDTFHGGILGSCDSYEDQTTENCVMALIDSAICAPAPADSLRSYPGTADGCWLPNQIIPKLASTGWDILRLDRAWAHFSSDSISSIIASVGCAICFSKPRAWWIRAVIERTFGELTARGAKRIASTYGSGPNDPSRNQPETKAALLNFTRNDLIDISRQTIRELNERSKDGPIYESSLALLKNIESRPGYFSRKLPLTRSVDRPTMWKSIPVRVEANVQHGVSPFVRIPERCRFRGDVLSDAWGLVGKGVCLQIYRWDINRARIVDQRTGELIDTVSPDAKWKNYCIDWNTFRLIQKYGKTQRSREFQNDPVRYMREQKQKKINDNGFINKEEAREIEKLESVLQSEKMADDENEFSENINNEVEKDDGGSLTKALSEMLGWNIKTGSFGHE